MKTIGCRVVGFRPQGPGVTGGRPGRRGELGAQGIGEAGALGEAAAGGEGERMLMMGQGGRARCRVRRAGIARLALHRDATTAANGARKEAEEER